MCGHRTSSASRCFKRNFMSSMPLLTRYTKSKSVTANLRRLPLFRSSQIHCFPPLADRFIEAVPDNIHRVGNRLIVPLLTGFPFIPGTAEVQSVSLKNGHHETLIPDLTSAIDVLHVETGSGDSYFTLEFSANQLGGLPGRLRYFSSAGAAPETVVPAVITPTSMARDEETGDIFITNIFPGTVTRVQFP